MAENICNFSSGHQINRLRLHCTLIAPNKLFIQKVSNFWSSRRCRRTTLPKNKIQLNVVAAIWTSTNSVSTAAKCQVVAVRSPMILLVIDARLTVVELSSHSLSTFIFHAAKHWQTIVNEQKATFFFFNSEIRAFFECNWNHFNFVSFAKPYEKFIEFVWKCVSGRSREEENGGIEAIGAFVFGVENLYWIGQSFGHKR